MSLPSLPRLSLLFGLFGLFGTALLGACAHQAAPLSAQPGPLAPAPLACGKVIDHLVGMMPKAAAAPQEAKDKLAGAMSQACEQDAWSEAAKACLMAAQSHDAAMTQCHDKLTQAQMDSATEHVSAIMGTGE